MSDTKFDIDPQLLTGFVDDSLDDLEALDSLFIQLEKHPSDLDTIGAIFRPVHSIKGNSAFFGLMKLKKLAHELETLLDMARKEQLIPDQGIISILLTGMDRLKNMLTRTRDGQAEIEDEAQFDALVEEVIQARDMQGDHVAIGPKLLKSLDELKKACADLETSYDQEIESIIGLARQLVSGTEGADSEESASVPKPLQTIVDILSEPCEGNISDTHSGIVLECLTELRETTEHTQALELLNTALDEYETVVNTLGFDPLLRDLMLDKMNTLMTLNAWKESTEPKTQDDEAEQAHAEPGDKHAQDTEPSDEQAPATQQPGKKPENSKSKGDKDSQKTMRIAEQSIESFLGYVGELIVIGEMYTYLQRKAADKDNSDGLPAEFKRVNETFHNLSSSLQKSIMDIRKMPVRFLLQKAPRMVRDIAATSGKQITVELEGQDIAIDKRLIETLDAPLTHMVRNAADHGVEMPQDRSAAGKPEQGTVRIAVRETEDDVIIAISDDGRGLDYQAIKAKAIKLGMVEEEQELSQEQITDMLFASGVSTAKEVTDVSGRGVGMDVVKRNIVEANGEITVTSEPGQGSEFRIRLPKAVSTQIIDGYLVQLGENRYVIPLERVREIFRIEDESLSTVTGRGECVLRHDKLLPVVRIFGCQATKASQRINQTVGQETGEPTDQMDDQIVGQTMVTLETGGKTVAFYVDDVLGIQRVVLKELVGLELETDVYTAAAVMGDGTVAMVLDVDHLTEAVEQAVT